MSSPLTPTLVERNRRRANFLSDLRNDAHSFMDTSGSSDLSEHDLLMAHPDPAMRRLLHPDRRRRHEIGHRYLTLRRRIEALDLSKAADWTTFTGLGAYYSTSATFLGEWFNLKKTLAQACPKLATLPAAALTALEEAKYAHATTPHEIHEAFEAELHEVLGSDRHFLGTAIVTIPQDDIAKAGILVRRRNAMLGLATPPDDPYATELWGHDARLKSLALTPKVGSTIPLTPAFSPDVLAYTMGHRGNQVHRIDAVAEDSAATVTPIKESGRAGARVHAEMGDAAEYVIKPNANAKLSSLTARTGNTPRTLDPAFDADTSAYETPSDIPLGAITATGVAAEPGAIVATSFVPNQSAATSIEVKVTAPDGTTTKTYTITRASG